jgi:hypothetical protein
MTTKARKTLSWLGCAALLGAALGCSSQSAETKRQLETLNERMLILQNDRDRLVERVDALEAQAGKPSRGTDESEATSSAGGRPLLKVVRLEPTPGGDTEAQARKAGSEAAGEQPAATGASVSANPDEPKVVLYGEGTASGVRASTEGVNTP